MKLMIVIQLTLFCPLLLLSNNICAKEAHYKLVGLNNIAVKHQQKVRQWLEFVNQASAQTIGPYPFDIVIEIRLRKAKEPVPWANTRRGNPEIIEIHIDSDYQKKQFIQDWTAYHEISHLALPYLGRQGRWFAEGFASFMQYQIMDSIGIVTGSTRQRYIYKLTPHLNLLSSQDSPAQVVDRLFDNRRYRPAYWGSAWYFVMADEMLNQHGVRLIDIVHDYVQCCRHKDQSVADIVKSWDTLAPRPVFSELLEQFQFSPSVDFYRTVH